MFALDLLTVAVYTVSIIGLEEVGMRHAQMWTVSLAIAVLACLVTRAVPAQTPEVPPKDTEARKQWIQQQREEAMKRREEFLKLPPEEQQRIKEERQKQAGAWGAQARPMDIHGPLPLPVEVKNLSDLASGGTRGNGKPAGGACAASEKCQLRLNPPTGQALIVTAVWSATKVTCDETSTATPPNGAPIAPGWRCEQSFSAEGQGAGYAGYLVSK